MTRERGVIVAVRTPVVIGAIVAAVAVAPACGGGGSPEATGPTGPTLSPAAERPASTARLRILSPKNGEVTSSTVDLRVSLKGAIIVPQASTDLKPDEGHLHVYLDEQLISMTEGLRQSIPNVPTGQHLLKVEFVASDHAPFDPRVITAVSFEAAP